MTIQNVLDWLQEAEDNNCWQVSTQSVKRHLEEVQKQQLIITDVGCSLPSKETMIIEMDKEIDLLSNKEQESFKNSLYHRGVERGFVKCYEFMTK